MNEHVCLVCLKTFQRFTDDTASSQEVEKCGVSLLAKFLKFTKNYLQIPSHQMFSVDCCSDDGNGAFCEKCVIAVINPICTVYLQFLSAQLRLSSELEKLGRLLETSQLDNDNKLEGINILKLTEQLGIDSVTILEEFRSLLTQKCKLKRKVTLPGYDENDDDDIFNPSDLDSMDPLELQLQSSDADDDDPLEDSGDLEAESIEIKIEPAQFQDTDHCVTPEDEENLSQSAPTTSIEKLILMPVTKTEQFVDESELDCYEHHHHPDNEFTLDDKVPTQIPPTKSESGGKPEEKGDQQKETGVSSVNANNLQLVSVPRFVLYVPSHILQESESSAVGMNPEAARKEVPCPICAKGFSTRQSMLLHKRNQHTQNRSFPFQCSECDAGFSTKYGLVVHADAVHNPETHVCPQCNKVFAHFHYLKDHCKRVHPQPDQKEKWHKCPICEKRFLRKNNMKDHFAVCSRKNQSKLK